MIGDTMSPGSSRWCRSPRPAGTLEGSSWHHEAKRHGAALRAKMIPGKVYLYQLYTEIFAEFDSVGQANRFRETMSDSLPCGIMTPSLPSTQRTHSGGSVGRTHERGYRVMERSCENCGNTRCANSVVVFWWDECVESKFTKHWIPKLEETIKEGANTHE